MLMGRMRFSLLSLTVIAPLASMPALVEARDAADLAISAIHVYPQHSVKPTAGRPFTVQVYATNLGGEISGPYDIALYIEDLSHGSKYPIGTFRKEPMRPGEQYVVYSSNKRIVNDAGGYRVVAEIKPLFGDARPENNKRTYDFDVVR